MSAFVCQNRSCGRDNRRTQLGSVRRGTLVVPHTATVRRYGNRVYVTCPVCGQERSFEGTAVQGVRR